MIRKSFKEIIITEYLTSGLSYRQIAAKWGVNHQSLHRWVHEYLNDKNAKMDNSRIPE
ncbi:MAG: transposase [Adhaeribacter sp.]